MVNHIKICESYAVLRLEFIYVEDSHVCLEARKRTRVSNLFDLNKSETFRRHQIMSEAIKVHSIKKL